MARRTDKAEVVETHIEESDVVSCNLCSKDATLVRDPHQLRGWPQYISNLKGWGVMQWPYGDPYHGGLVNEAHVCPECLPKAFSFFGVSNG